MEVMLTILTVIVITTLVTSKSMDRTCNSATCNEIAEDILNTMDENYQPCNKFYEFSCGGFLKRVIPPSQSTISPSTDMNKRIREQIKSSLKSTSSKGPAVAKSMVRKFMDTCVSTNHTRHRSQQYLRSDLERLGGFPALKSNWDEKSIDLMDVIGNITKIGFGVKSLLDIKFWRIGLKAVLFIDDPKFGIDRHNLINHLKYRNDSQVKAYFDLMLGTLKNLQANSAIVECDMQEVLELLMSLAQITMTPTQKLEFINPKTMPIRNLSTYGSDEIPWTKLLQNMFGPESVSEDSQIAVTAIKLLRGVDRLFRKYTKRTWVNYLLWSVTFDALPYMDESFLKLLDKFYSVVHGRKQRELPEKTCQYQMTGRLQTALSSMYVADNVPRQLIQQVKPMLKNIKNTFDASLITSTWMDAQTQQKALRKFRKVGYIIGYPQEILNDTIMNSYLAPINLVDNVYENKKKLLVLEFKKYAENLKAPIDRLDWKVYAQSIPNVEAYFYYVENVLELTSGLLQKGFFSPDQPEFRNYGACGATFAHELVHSIDEYGKKYDENGNAGNWWSKSSLTAFNKIKNCMENRYNSYKYSNYKVNGIRTFSENHADNVGIRQAYLAYVKVMHKDKEIPKLKKYTKKQLFWISFAQRLCAKYNAQEIKHVMNVNLESIAECRVTGVISNQPEFIKDFNCSASSQMARESKCQFW